MKPTRRRPSVDVPGGLVRLSVVILAAITAAVVGGCGTETAPSTPTTSAAVDFPYPPFEIRTDIAVPLPARLRDAAQFALDMSVDDRLKNDPNDDEADRRFRSQIAPEVDVAALPPGPDTAIGETGGALHRAVGARDLPDDTVEVTICQYDTPGLYTKLKDGRVVSSDIPMSVQRPLVQWTDRPAADGTTPAGPRWLWVGETASYNLPAQQVAELCEPFKPEPFIHKMPDPTSAASPTSATPSG